MRALILLAAIVLILAIVGWISFSHGPDRASINLESGKIREDTREVMETGAKALHKAGDKVEQEANRQPNGAPSNPETAPVRR